jgi:hypothetical protein
MSNGNGMDDIGWIRLLDRPSQDFSLPSLSIPAMHLVTSHKENKVKPFLRVDDPLRIAISDQSQTA